MSKFARLAIALAAAALLATGLSGCLVKQKPLKTYTSSTDKLRIYQHGDFIEYEVKVNKLTGAANPTTQFLTGTLRVEWRDLDSTLYTPTGTATPATLKIKTSTLILNGEESPQIITQYVYQDLDTGEEQLVAMKGPGVNYWLHSQGANAGGGATEFITVFPSPLIENTNTPVHYYVMDDCTTTSLCTVDLGIFNNELQVQANRPALDTILARFINTYYIKFRGNVSDLVLSGNLPVLFDILDACSASHAQHGTDVNLGYMYVVPEIGMVEMGNSCYNQVNYDTMHFTYKLLNTNINIF